MMEKESSVRLDESCRSAGPMKEKPLVEVSEIVPAEGNAEDLYLVMGNRRYQFSSSMSPIYQVKEYFLEVELQKGAVVKFAHKDGRVIPINREPNCGYTLVGKAQKYFSAVKALTAKGEIPDDQTYVYINEHTQISYTGDTGRHKMYLRIYDSTPNGEQDRWVVIYID